MLSGIWIGKRKMKGEKNEKEKENMPEGIWKKNRSKYKTLSNIRNTCYLQKQVIYWSIKRNYKNNKHAHAHKHKCNSVQ